MIDKILPYFSRVWAKNPKYDLIIIDGGGRVTATARAAVASADFIIIPTLPSKLDMLSTEEFIDTVINEVKAIKPDIVGGIILNQFQKGTDIGKVAIKHLEDLGYPVFDTMLHLYVAYREATAVGKSVIEYDAKSRAANEMSNFFKELKGVL